MLSAIRVGVQAAVERATTRAAAWRAGTQESSALVHRPPDSRRARELAVIWAAIALLALGWVAARPLVAPEAGSCPHPRDLDPRQPGHSAVVACDRRPGGAPVRGSTRLLFGEPLDLNREPVESLEVLPGIGPARAAAIVAERERRPFGRVADLRAVRGIGPRTVAGLAGWVAVAPPPVRAGAAPDG